MPAPTVQARGTVTLGVRDVGGGALPHFDEVEGLRVPGERFEDRAFPEQADGVDPSELAFGTHRAPFGRRVC